MSPRGLLAFGLLSLISARAAADDQPAAPKPPYALPFALRSAVAATSVRLDAALSFENAGFTYASTVSGSVAFAPDAAVVARFGLVHDAPNATYNATAVTNPLFGVHWTPQPVRGLRVPAFVGVTLPIGMGGGNPPAGATWPAGSAYAAEQAGVYARSAMDNALFAVNYLAFVTGVGVAYVTHGFTFQAEATVFQLVRVRGEQVDTNPMRTNFTTGLHVGYTPVKWLAVNAELRAQVWLSSVAAVTKDPTKREQLTFAVGARTRIDFVRDKIIARPGVAFVHPLDDPMTKNGYEIVMVDFPVSF